MEKHPGASESSLLALFQNVARERPEVLRAVVGHFMKHSQQPRSSSEPLTAPYPGCLLLALSGRVTRADECLLGKEDMTRTRRDV
jgi:hypothetical protein